MLKLFLRGNAWTYDSVAHELGMSSSAAHRSVDRSTNAGLFNASRRAVNRVALTEFLVHGLRYVFPPEWRGEARGIPTAWAALPLSKVLASSGQHQPVWPDPHGDVFGIALKPLDPRAPEAARGDKSLWELLALIDGIRIGAARERGLASKELEKRLRGGTQ